MATFVMLKRRALLGMLVAGALLVGGVAYASIPDASGVIHGCYKTSGGQLRVIDSPSQTCMGSETALSWSQQGPTGATGATGPQGAPGTQSYYTNRIEAAIGVPGFVGGAGGGSIPCDTGDSALSGGWHFSNPSGTIVIERFEPSPDGTAWDFSFRRFADGSTTEVDLFVTCADLAPYRN